MPAPPGLPITWTSAGYDGPVRTALLAFKERGRRELATPLGALLAGPLCRLATHPDTVTVGIPASPGGRRARGYDHVGLLVRSAVAHGAPPAAPLLRWARATQDQAGLGVAARERNREAALVARPCPGLRVVIVDDIVTTGATLSEAARALGLAGAEVLGAATVASTRRRLRQAGHGDARDAMRD
jgi:predicted amidophosphoribosyltransferase